MTTKTLIEKVGKNVFSSGDMSGVLGFLVSVASKENFTLTDFYYKENAEEAAEEIPKTIRTLFGKEYICSVEVDGENYKINCSLIKDGE